MKQVRLILASGLIMVLFSAVAAVGDKEHTSLEWLEISKEAATHWKTELTPQDPGLMTISPQWERSTGSIPKRIFMMLPKNSSSYSLATSVLLETLYQEGLYADITLMNFNKDDNRGHELIQMAEAANADLIFSMGSESQTFFHKFYHQGKIQVVTCTSKDPVLLGFMKDYEQGGGANIAYTSLNVPLAIQLNYLQALKPNLKNIGLMYDKTHAEVMATEVVPAQQLFESLGFKVMSVAVGSGQEEAGIMLGNLMPRAIKAMQQNDPSLENSIFWMTSSTSVFSNINVIKDLSGNIPVIGSIPNVVTEGEDSAVLAIGIDRRNNARLASIYAVKILKGQTTAGKLKVGVVTPPDIAINFLVARKIGLKIPFDFFESAAFIYDYNGKTVRAFGQKL